MPSFCPAQSGRASRADTAALRPLARDSAEYPKVETMTREPTAAVKLSCLEAKAALILAIEAVDDVLSEIKNYDAAIEHPELIAAFMSYAGHVYHAKATQYH